MDENELNGTEILVGIGTTLDGLGIAAHIAVAHLGENPPQKPSTNTLDSSSMSDTNHQYKRYTHGTDRH